MRLCVHEKQEESVGLAVLPLQYLCLLPADQDCEDPGGDTWGVKMRFQVRCVRFISVHRHFLASGVTG